MYSNAKTAQIAAGFLSLAADRRLSKLALIKLMYIADRTSVARYGSTISDDTHFSLPYGPILSNALNAMSLTGSGFGPWAELIYREGENILHLHAEVSLDDLDELSDAEAEIIAEVAAKYAGYTAGQLVNLTHGFPEWQNPGASSLPILFADIARAVGLTPEQVDALEEEHRIERELERILVAG